MTTTTLLTVSLVGTFVILWARNESYLLRQQKRIELQAMANIISDAWVNSLFDQNWSQMRLSIESLMVRHPEVVYVIISDRRLGNQIVAASSDELIEQYIPDIVPASVSRKATGGLSQVLFQETFILRPVYFFSKEIRAQRGELIIEAAYDIGTNPQNPNAVAIGTVRIGSSLKRLDQSLLIAVTKVGVVGFIGLLIGLLGSYTLAIQIGRPIQQLHKSAGIIAGGDLQHRASVESQDELGALGQAFNDMAIALQKSFQKLQKTLATFALFVPQRFLDVVAKEGIENIKVGVACTHTVTILFADIRGYTSMSEQLTAWETFHLLNNYLACMGEAIENHNGFIDKYIGDAIMALFDDASTDMALKAAQAMQKSLIGFNKEQLARQQPHIQIGIGLHRGEVVMGTVGFTSRIDSTIIGDPVNVAARVESLTRYYNCGIIVTDAVVASLAEPEKFQLRLIDKAVKVKGKDEPITIYELIEIASFG